MYCENCGNKVDDDAIFCSRCGNQLLPQKAGKAQSRHVETRRRQTDDFLCFGEESEQDGWIGGIIMIIIGIFLASIFLDFAFPIEIILPGAFILIGLGIIIRSRQR